jgi:Heterokaryon incompatibility protein (HET)
MDLPPLDESLDEVRVLSILPESSESPLIHCRLTTVSLQHFTAAYRAHAPSATTIGITATTNTHSVLSSWIKSRSQQGEAVNPPSNSPVPKFPNEEWYRFDWGDFACLSYTWGDSTVTRTIIINRHEVEVTENLEEALRTLRSTCKFGADFKLWVDAVCIDQKDDKERESQVGKMRILYGLCWSVMAWLGRTADKSDQVLVLLDKLADYYGTAADQAGWDLRDRLLKDLGYLGTGCWLALLKFWKRPYWDRLWVIQELALGSSRTLVFCGDAQSEWRRLALGLGTVHTYMNAVLEACCRHDSRAAGIEIPDSGVWDTAVDHHVWKDLWPLSYGREEGDDWLNFDRLLEVATFSSASNPRDKVYGLLGMMDPRIATNILLDYSSSTIEVYASVAKTWIQQFSDLDILRHGNPWGSMATPSWVPDWTWRGRLRHERPGTKYNAHGSMPVEASFSGTGLLATCKGVIIDQIDGLGAQDAGTAQITRHYESKTVVQSKLHRSAYGDSASTESALSRLLYGDRVGRGSINDVHRNLGPALLHLPSNQDSAMQQFKDLKWNDFAAEGLFYPRWTGWRAANDSLRLGGRLCGDYFTEIIPKGANNKDYWDAYDAFDRTSLNRRLMTTTKGYFGWAPDNRHGSRNQQTKSGDLLCIVFGCSTPLVIRPAGEFYQVVGEAYVQGMMEGEVLQALDRGECQAEDITFC